MTFPMLQAAADAAGRVGPVIVFFIVLVAAAVFTVFGVVRSVRAFGFGNGRVFTRPAAPWTVIGAVILLVDAGGLLLWFLSSH